MSSKEVLATSELYRKRTQPIWKSKPKLQRLELKSGVKPPREPCVSVQKIDSRRLEIGIQNDVDSFRIRLTVAILWIPTGVRKTAVLQPTMNSIPSLRTNPLDKERGSKESRL